MTITEDQIKDALRAVKYPGFSRDIVSFGLVRQIEIKNSSVVVQLALATNEPAIPRAIMQREPTLSVTHCHRSGARKVMKTICDDLTFRLIENSSGKYFRMRSEHNSAQKEKPT